MSTPIKIVVTAETAAAAAQLKQFAQQSAGGLKMLEQAGNEAGGSLTEMRHSALALHEGFRTLETGIYLLGGQRFPELAQAVLGARSAMMLVRTGAILTGATMAAVGTVLAGLTVSLLPTAVFWWRAHAAAEEEAKSAADLHADVLERQRDLMREIAELQKRGFLSPADITQMELARNAAIVANPDDPSAGLRAQQQFLLQRNLTLPATEAMVELQKLQKKIHDEMLTGISGERAKAKEELDQRLADIEAWAATAGPLIADPNNVSAMKLAANQAFDLKDAELTKREKALELAEEQKALQTSLLAIEVDAGDQRAGLAQKEYDIKVDALDRWKKAGLMSNEEYNAAYLEAARQRESSIKAETVLVEQQTKRRAELQQEIARAETEAELRSIEGDPTLTASQKAGLSLPYLRKLDVQDTMAVSSLQQQHDNLPASDANARLEIESKIEKIKERQADVQNKINAAEGQNSFGYQLQVAYANLQNINNAAHEVAQLFDSTINGAILSVSSNLTKVIMGTQTWRAALYNIETSVIGGIIQGLIQIVTRMIIMQGVALVMKALNLSTGTEKPDPASETAWGSAAMLRSIADLGPISGPIAFAAELAMGAAAGAAIASRDSGGPGEAGMPYFIGTGAQPELFVPQSAGDFYPRDQWKGMTAAKYNDNSGPGNSPVVEGHKVTVVNVNSRSELLDVIKSSEAGQIISNHVRNNRIKIGIGT